MIFIFSVDIFLFLFFIIISKCCGSRLSKRKRIESGESIDGSISVQAAGDHVSSKVPAALFFLHGIYQRRKIPRRWTIQTTTTKIRIEYISNDRFRRPLYDRLNCRLNYDEARMLVNFTDLFTFFKNFFSFKFFFFSVIPLLYNSQFF